MKWSEVVYYLNSRLDLASKEYPHSMPAGKRGEVKAGIGYDKVRAGWYWMIDMDCD